MLNAYLVPVMSRYLEAAEDALRSNGVDAPLLIMQSNGGMASAEQVAEAPVYSVLSGPAAGVVASTYTAQQSEQPNLITLDVGGTSTDIGVVTDGRARMTTTATVGERSRQRADGRRQRDRRGRRLDCLDRAPDPASK